MGTLIDAAINHDGGRAYRFVFSPFPFFPVVKRRERGERAGSLPDVYLIFLPLFFSPFLNRNGQMMRERMEMMVERCVEATGARSYTLLFLKEQEKTEADNQELSPNSYPLTSLPPLFLFP